MRKSIVLAVTILLAIVSPLGVAEEDCSWKGIWMANHSGQNFAELKLCEGASWGKLILHEEGKDPLELRATITGGGEVRAFSKDVLVVTFPFKPEQFGPGRQIYVPYNGMRPNSKIPEPFGLIKLRQGVPPPKPGWMVQIVGAD